MDAKWVWIAVGGGAGSVLRYWLAHHLQRLAVSGFPLGTLLVNVTGCLGIGLLAGLFAGSLILREEYRLGLTVGLLGGFTTFSTFGFETFQLGHTGYLRLALLNILLSCTLGVLAVWAGHRVAEMWR